MCDIIQYLLNSNRLYLLLPVMLSLNITLIRPAYSQSLLEEVVVTAQKRAESLQDTPVAVTAFTGDDLERRGVSDSVGLSNIVPNVIIATEGARDAVFINIRGIS